MKIKTDEITSVIKQEIEQFASQLEISEVGQVVEVGDGIARVYGLSKVMAGELLEFEGRGGTVMGQAMNLEHDTVGAVLYGESTGIREGDTVRATGRLLEVPVGEAMLGRVVDPLGNPIDGGPAIQTDKTRKLDKRSLERLVKSLQKAYEGKEMETADEIMAILDADKSGA